VTSREPVAARARGAGGPIGTADFARRLAEQPAPAIVDVREESSFAAGHLAGSGSLPVAELERRRAELPSRDATLVVVADDGARARAGAERLEAMGYAGVAWLDAPIEALGDRAGVRGPGLRMWQPAPFLAEVLDRIPVGAAVDLAAGSGREATFLALHGFEVEAWDAAPEALERAEDLARREGVRVAGVAADLERERPPLPEARWALVTCFRFLHRPLFPAIARSLRPGGHLVYETYRVGQERFGRPRRPQYLLEDGELANAFASLGLEILHASEPAPAHGPITARLWARRP
jgi:rhodanese-related sulfurtransferase